MGNIWSCSCNVNKPFDRLFSLCSRDEGPPKKTLSDLLYDWARLNAARDHVKRSIQNSPEIVDPWVGLVETTKNEVDKLITDYAQSDNKCFNNKKSNSLWEQIDLVDGKVLNLLSQVPDMLNLLPQVPVVFERPQLVPTEPITGMESMLDEVWSHVENQQDDHVRLIGLYGMGGVGKTTLLKAVHNKLCSSTLNYDLQLWIEVSKTPNLMDIQNRIGKKIGFNGNDWEIKSQDAKAIDIYNILSQKKCILLLDDLWDRFDLVKIGIPLPDSQNKSKIIFTTRSLHVCGQMEATPIQVRCLSVEDAWTLFKKSVGENTLNAHGDIDGLARVVMKECKGLPLALIVIGRAMTLKTTADDWKQAVDELQRHAAEFSTMTDKVFTPLRYSYDNLTNEAIRSCLLYCSLYAEDKEISKHDLVEKWICEGFLGRFHDLDTNRNEGYSYLNTLVDANLLEKCSVERVKMHDVVRDMALWIAGDRFYVKARAGLTQIPKDVKWKHVEKMSLMDNSIEELNNGPTEVTNLKTMLCNHGKLSSIDNDFWKFVPKLEVLDLSGNRELTNLPDEFCELVFLKYLNLSYTKLKELPNAFKKLERLKYLNVENTGIYTIPEGILSSMKELFVFRCGGKENIVCSEFLGENLVKEFDGLKCLQDVVISATSKVEISNLTSSINLLNCITRFTLTDINDSTCLDILFLKEMKHLLLLRIQGLKNVEKIVVGEGQGLETSTTRNQNGFNTLRHLEVMFCSRLKNLSWLVFFPNIESIDVLGCCEMQTLVSENEYKLDNEVEVFAKLQTLELSWLEKLESIYFTSLSFPCLNTLFVGYGCENLKRLPFNSRSCNQGCGITIKCTSNGWNELQWEDEDTRTTFSSCFQSYY